MEVRPIDANALKEKISKGLPAMSPGEYIKVDLVIRSIINEQPPLDYEPVVHAHWERHYTFTDRHNKKHYWGYHCSSCGKGWIEAQFEKHYYCYCCGAKMDKEVKE